MKNQIRILIILCFGLCLEVNAQTITNYGVGSGTQAIHGSFFGYNAGKVATGVSNTFVGSHSGFSNTSGEYNAYLGVNTGRVNTGSNNVFIGFAAGRYNTTGASNVFLGRYAGAQEMGSSKLYIANTSNKALIVGDFAKSQVGINMANASELPTDTDYKLAIKGKIITEEVKVQHFANWPDYVFYEDYTLTPLPQLASEIETLGHLPNMPSAEEVKENGFELGTMDAKLLEKVEELTLYLIDVNKTIQSLQKENENLKQRLDAIGK